MVPQTIAAISALVFMVAAVWLVVSLLRMIGRRSRPDGRRHAVFSLSAMALSIVATIGAAIYATTTADDAGRRLPSDTATAVEVPPAEEAGDTERVAVAVPDPPEPEVEPVVALSAEERATIAAAQREAALRALSKWRVSRGRSAMDDSPTVQINLQSENTLPARFSGRGPATLSLRCLENTTSATFRFNGHFMADIQSYGQVTYRVDDRQARTVRMQESTNNEWLGLWRGAQAIPFIRELLDADRLVVRATPFSESPMEASFTITGLSLHLDELRQACNW